MDAIDYKINRTHLYEQIAQILENAIIKPDSGMAEKLPSEQALADKFGVSRTVVREALKLLKERGLIELRNGEGSYITKPGSDTVSNAIQRIIHTDGISIDDVYNMRIILEVASCRLAALNASQEDLEKVQLILSEMESRKLDLPVRIGLDADFHIAIAHASRNRLLGMFVETMTALLTDVIGRGIQVPGGNEDGLMRHRSVLEAIRTGDPDTAENAIRDHLDVSRRNVKVVEEMKKLQETIEATT